MATVTLTGPYKDLLAFLRTHVRPHAKPSNVKVGKVFYEEHELPITYKIDYDWKNPEGTSAEGAVTINGKVSDDRARALLIENDGDIADEFENEYVSFQPDTVNDMDVESSPADERQYCWVVQACLQALRAAPGTRQFNLSGDIG